MKTPTRFSADSISRSSIAMDDIYSLDKKRGQFLSQRAHSSISSYKLVGSFGQQSVDGEGNVVEEKVLVESRHSPVQFLLCIVELVDSESVLAILHEVSVLKSLSADLEPHVLNLFAAFRHCHQVALLHSPSVCLRDCLDSLYREKKRGSTLSASNTPLLSEGFIARILFGGLKGLDYVHSKGLVHTQLSASSLFVDPPTGIVRLGGLRHSQRFGSRFTRSARSNANLHPPEALSRTAALVVAPSFDIWAVGLLVIELVTGKVAKSGREKLMQMASDMLNGLLQPPRLYDFGYLDCRPLDTIVDQCLKINPAERATVNRLLSHAAVAQFEASPRALDAFWSKHSFESFLVAGAVNVRSLYSEMLSLQGASSDIGGELLLRIVRSLELSNVDSYLSTEKISSERLSKEFMAVESIVTCDWDDPDASRRVNDVSQNFSNASLDEPETASANSPGKPRTGTKTPAQIYGNDRHTSSRRGELIFFVKTSWDTEQRQVFISLQFSRWLKQGFISFPELIRVVDELNGILSRFPTPSSLRASPLDTVSVGFNFHLRKAKTLFGGSIADKDALATNMLTVEVALRSDAVLSKEARSRVLLADAGLPMPEGDKMPLQAAVSYQFVNAEHFERGAKMDVGRLIDYQAKPTATELEINKLRYLLEERRFNPNRQYASQALPSAISNEARNAKLWSNFDRDFLFKYCQLAIPYEISPGVLQAATSAEQINDDVHLQLLKTRSKQEGDRIQPIKLSSTPAADNSGGANR